MRDRGRCFYGRSDGHHDAIRISPSNNHFVQVRYDNGTWHDFENAFGEIVELIWQDHGGVDAVLTNGKVKRVGMLLS